ncbi:hypothetical protein QFC20_005940 [Naganishia adeliensis]|uniref:Uncharacterized protein n=1 Tax=Naganishia adeliensis TaxID=92952 RepID=A0ACC2VGL8_9TREE|nr:hypothetical protein QFC20_005940 [Naganishia adeliensis]
MSLSIFIRSPDTFSERKFPASLTIDALKAKLEHVTGIPYAAQVLNVFPTADAAERGEGGVSLDDGDTNVRRGRERMAVYLGTSFLGIGSGARW